MVKFSLFLLEKNIKWRYNKSDAWTKENNISVRKKKGRKKYGNKRKKCMDLLVFILSGLVIGGLLGQLAENIDFLWWLSYGQSFGLSTPIQLDLNVIQITFGLMLKINIASIIGVIIAILIYRKV